LVSNAAVLDIFVPSWWLYFTASSVKDCCLVADAGDGELAKTRTQQVRMNAGVGVDEDTLRGESVWTLWLITA